MIDSAMTAAEGLRTRAAADAEATVAEAQRASTAAREDAWEVGTELLRQADEEGGRLVSQAKEDALFIRAEAEQEAKRLVTDARRQADDMVRSSREDGERIVVMAKAESEAILEGALQAADKAQERARALETRRAELLNELEAAESAIREIETARDERPSGADVGARVFASDSDARTHWPEDEGAVRILPSAPPEPEEPEPVDAEAMAAEVEEMRAATAEPEEATPAATVEEDLAATAVPSPPEPDPAEEQSTTDGDEEPAHPEMDIAEEEMGIAEEAAAASDAAEPAAPEEPDLAEPEVIERTTVVTDDPGIDALFARLRHPEEAAPSLEAVPDPTAEPLEEPETVSEPPVLHVVPDLEESGEFEERDRLLLAIENTGLRGLKRRIVELQNRVLEELRKATGEWRLSHQLVGETMGDELDAVLSASYAAGHAAAADWLGTAEPQLTGGPEQGAAESFTADLYADIQTVLDRGGDPASRRLSADIGRAFRSWRTDDAERHVRQAARRAFNDGLVAAYARLEIPLVGVAAPGQPCGRCAAGTGIVWNPAEAAPPDVGIPPAGPECAALIVPADGDGFDSQTQA